MDILERILNEKRKRLRNLEKQTPLSELKRQLKDKVPAICPEKQGLTPNSFHVIAEIKRASPSQGIIPWRLSLEETLQAYESGGASLISILTEENFFFGGPEDFQKIRSLTSLPLLRKDFIFSEYQVIESSVMGADIILLIAGILDAAALSNLLHLTHELGLRALVECRDEEDISQALKAGAKIIGINNRDLRTFRINLERTQTLSPLIPPNCILVSESGIHTPEDAAFVSKYGAQAVLVGESCLLSPDPALHIRSLREAGLGVRTCPG
ncbi:MULTISPECIES: indole-3-glycerol phosphate synthase TrpC [Desulfitobacterium]|uniref:indole-3-glycerol-phosphate synthase n=1 Tax=Desulfitobacterium dehalogenans (strain ATCC 51507 / DSM 9161 / JW/IU-DC1) TaxID=756499 RepID=I4ADI2_DESDJ|nr:MULTISPECIES: indole-3-glycerol phosphate synthase TrpC [Desulfitobacterium]AFM02017.1 Indole-3-glycerol phosphate synthase [Desulfitobacterium dehalogenans ATCC 51507]